MSHCFDWNPAKLFMRGAAAGLSNVCGKPQYSHAYGILQFQISRAEDEESFLKVGVIPLSPIFFVTAKVVLRAHATNPHLLSR